MRIGVNEVDAEEVELPPSIIRTCADVGLGRILTLQGLFDALEEMEKDIKFSEGTLCKK